MTKQPLGLFSTLLLTCLTTIAMAQPLNSNDNISSEQLPKKITISGKIVDATSGKPLDYASVSVFSLQDSSLITGGLTDLGGNFTIKLDKQNFYVVADFLGFERYFSRGIEVSKNQSDYDLGIIEMGSSNFALEEVEIRAERSEVQFSLDKKIFNVGKDLANQGGSAEDILDNVPSVTVDIDGNVSLRGSQGVRILIDGKPSSLAGVGNTNGLRNIPSNLISQVEVITNPSARYEAEGMAGIINIVLKKDQGNGFNGAFDISGGYPDRYGASANLNYRKGDLNWFLNYGVNYRKDPGGGFTYQERTANDSVFILDLDRDRLRTGLSNSIRFGTEYFFSDKEQITGSFNLRKSNEENLGTLIYNDYINSFDDAGFISSTERIDDEEEDETNLEYNLNYRKEFSSREHQFNATVQFREKSEIENSDFVEMLQIGQQDPFSSLQQRSNNDEGTETWLFQADYVHPFSKDHKWEAGARSELRNIRNDFIVEEFDGTDWVSLQGLSNDFNYIENIHAAYLIYGNTYGKFSFQAGLRGELSDITTELLDSGDSGINERDFFNLFPSGHLNYAFNLANAVQLSYSARIRRPRFWDLNPFFTFQDNRNFRAGNPNVNPEFTDSYELSTINYWESFSVTGSIFHRVTDESIQRVTAVDNSDGTTLRVPLNLGTIEDTGFDLTASYSGISWLRLDLNWNIFRNKLIVDPQNSLEQVYNYYQTVRGYDESITSFSNRFDATVNSLNNVTWTGRITSRFTFWGSDLQIRGNYRAARVSAQGETQGIGSIDVGWTKDFLNKRLTATLGVRDLFNSRKRRNVVEIDNFFAESEFQWRNRTTTLTLSYRINQKKKREGNRGMRGDFDGGEF